MLGSKRHLICDGRGIPLAIQLTGANHNDSQQALALVDAVPQRSKEKAHGFKVGQTVTKNSSDVGVCGRPRSRPDCVLGDRGYDSQSIRKGLRVPGIVPVLAMRNTEHGSGLWSLEMGSGANLCLAESVSSPSSPLRKTSRYS